MTRFLYYHYLDKCGLVGSERDPDTFVGKQVEAYSELESLNYRLCSHN